jgi:RHS repeat-associated protein
VPTDKKFTGQRLDGTGLYYYGARYYDASIGRFISADTIVPNPANPQSFNRYSYCLNNPLRYVDSTGHEYDPYIDTDPASLSEGTLTWSAEGGWSILINGAWSPIGDALLHAMLSTYVDSPLSTWAAFLDCMGLLGSPARDWGGATGMLVAALLQGENTRAGILAGVLSGGTARLSPGGSVLIYENIDPGSLTGRFLTDILGRIEFTLGHVILSMRPEIPQDVIKHELGHVVQYDILGRGFLPVYGWCTLNSASNSLIVNGWLYSIGLGFFGVRISDLTHTLNPMENWWWGLPSWQWWLK